MVLVCPSMLSADPTALGESLSRIEHAGADCVHWDVMDGTFVDAITFGAHIIAAHRPKTALRFDTHLMIENPDKHLETFARAGSDVIIVHPETTKHLHRTLGSIKDLGKKAGVALNPATSTDCLEYCLDLVDMILIMSVNPGKSGQKFIESQIKKIANAKQLLDESKKSAEICVDGGINAETAKICVKNGANSLVTGAYLFKSNDYAKAIAALK